MKFLPFVEVYFPLQAAPEKLYVLSAYSVLEGETLQCLLYVCKGAKSAEHIHSIETFRDALRFLKDK